MVEASVPSIKGLSTGCLSVFNNMVTNFPKKECSGRVRTRQDLIFNNLAWEVI